MDWNTILHKGILRGGICILLTAAIVLGLVLPGTDMKPAQPKDPLEEESIREISVLKVGENINELQTIVVPNGGSAAPTEPEETNPDETNPDETEPNETVPQETESQEQDVDEGEEGNEDGNQGEEGGTELNLDLAAVMTWYRYGSEPKTITCSPGKAVSKTLNTAQLKNNQLKYQFELTGDDTRYVEITSVSLAEGDSAYRQVSDEGDVEIQLPGGNGDRKYTFQVIAMAEKENEEGETVRQEIQFFFVLKCEFSIDLDMELVWREKDAGEHTVTCGPDKVAAFSVQNYELQERVFGYTVNLKGALADNAEIVDAGYTTASGVRSGDLDRDGGSLILDPEPGKNTETYYLTFTVKTAERTVLYTYNLVYQEMLDVWLSFTWQEKSMVEHTMTCRPGGMATERIKNNQLSGGAVPYEMVLMGADSGEARITSVMYTSEAGSGELKESGALPMTMPEGGTSNTYRITVNALVKGQRMTFDVVLYYANDVTLQMEYAVEENGNKQQRLVSCENTKTRTAEAIYHDQLSNGILEYKMSVVGSDADSVSITSVNCFQSGSGRNITVDASGAIELLMKDGKTGENTFTIQAHDDGGNEYNFTISIPYKPRGENNIRILASINGEEIKDRQEIINGTKTNMSVKAWREDASGHVEEYIPANGVDTKLIVTFDEEIISYISSSGASSEYDLVPENPVEGDTNEHILHIYAEDGFGNYGEQTLTLIGQRREAGQKTGNASIYVDLTVLGLGVVGPVSYEVLAEEPVSYVITKALLGETLEEPFGAAKETFGWSGYYEGTLDIGFYLASLTTGYEANALEGNSWPGSTEEEVLEAIDERFGPGTGLATLWRCLYRNGLNKSEGSGGTFSEFDYTSGSGWMYSVGGTTYYPGQAMSAVYLQDGDSLTVRYTLAQGWDVGGGSPGYSSTVGYCVSAVNGKFNISHRMETVIGENGAEILVCQCCGIVQKCAHRSIVHKSMDDRTHMQFCEDCNAYIGDPEEHIWDQNADSPNHTCTLCGESEAHLMKEDPQNPHGTPPTCTVDGYKNEYCVICLVNKEDVPDPATGHTYDNQWYHNKDSLTEHYQLCSTCGEPYNHGEHQYQYDPDSGDNICTLCEVLHTWGLGCSGSETVDADRSTCQVLYYTCGGCGLDLTMEGIFEEYHSFANGECTICGEPDPNVPEQTECAHVWVDGEVIKPTCESPGQKQLICDFCDKPGATVPIDALGHNWEEVSVSEPGCTTEGKRIYYCDRCGTTKEEPISETGHQWSDWFAAEDPSKEQRECESCGKVEQRTIEGTIEVPQDDPEAESLST